MVDFRRLGSLQQHLLLRVRHREKDARPDFVDELILLDAQVVYADGLWRGHPRLSSQSRNWRGVVRVKVDRQIGGSIHRRIVDFVDPSELDKRGIPHQSHYKLRLAA